MDHREFYKSRNLIKNSPRKIRAENANKLRSIKRKNAHTEGRDIDLSLQRVDRQNFNSEKKIPKKELYFNKFRAWKEEKENRLKNEKINMKKPFISTVKSNSQPKTSFAPKDFVFKPTLNIPKPLVTKIETTLGGNVKKQIVPSRNKQTLKTPEKVNRELRKRIRQVAGPDQKKKIKVGAKTPVPKEKKSYNNSIRFLTSTRRKDEQTTNRGFECDFISPPPLKILNGPINQVRDEHIDELIPKNVSLSRKSLTIRLPKMTAKENEPPIDNPTTEKTENSVEPIKELRRSRRSNSIPYYTIHKHSNIEKLKIKNDIDSPNSLAKMIAKTPDKKIQSPSSDAIYYVSPYVTTSRGKGSAKKEIERREKIYKLCNTSLTADETVTSRRRRESTKYFRKCLNDEIVRLENLCENWSKYDTENVEDAIDMINATLGQTKLLMSKKFKQFDGLIDQCELSLNSSRIIVSPEDLEGFWSVVKQQIENIDKRFDNLNRWKSNDWKDPDEISIPIKKNLTKVMKRRKNQNHRKPSASILEFLKNAHSKYLNKNPENENVLTDDIMNPSKDVTQQMVLRKRHSSQLPKSILKTPVSIKKRKTVVFNENCL